MLDFPTILNSMMMRQSMDKGDNHLSPLNQGRVDYGYANLDVKLLHAPNREDFVKTALAGEYAHGGGNMEPIAYIDYLDSLNSSQIEQLAIKSLEGGLEQFKESDTVTFLVYGCTRGFTHEIVRTRNGAWFLQQTMRHSNMGNANVRVPEYITEKRHSNKNDTTILQYVESLTNSVRTYQQLIENDIPYQDARGVLPIQTETWIIVGMPLRTFINMAEYRMCTMFYPEMVHIIRKMGQLLVDKCPWLENDIKITCQKTKVCEYRGVETTGAMCSYPWSHIRKWKSNKFNPNSTDILLKDHNSDKCPQCSPTRNLPITR